MDKTYLIVGSLEDGALESVQGIDEAIAFLLHRFQTVYGMGIAQSVTACAWVNSYKRGITPRGIGTECLNHYITLDDQRNDDEEERQRLFKVIRELPQSEALNFLCDGEALGKLGFHDQDIVQNVYDEVSA